MNIILKKINSIPWQSALLFTLTLGLAPFSPPHIYSKLMMLFSGSLTEAVDIFDFCFHGLPWLILIIKVIFYLKNKKKVTSL